MIDVAQTNPASATAGQRGKTSTLDSIQYLRGIAAMMVVVFHVFPQLQRMGLNWPEPNALSSGVDVFFVISGFVMTYSTARHPGRGGLAFLRDRLLRIAPLYWTLSLLMVVLLLTMPQLAQTSRFDARHALLSFLFIPAMHPVLGHYWPLIVPGWTLNYEMFFYVIFALALGSGGRARTVVTGLTVWALVVLTLVPLFVPVDGLAQFYTRSQILEFGFGIVLGEWYLRTAQQPSGVWWLAIVLGAIGLGLSGHTAGLLPQAVVPGIPAALVVVGMLRVPLRIDGLWERVAARLGDASYSIYLSHYLVMSAIGQVWHKLVPAGPLGWIGFALVAPVVCALVGIVVYHGLEQSLGARLGALVNPAAAARSRPIGYVVAPSGQAGGGMGRVKDYILGFDAEGGAPLDFRPLVTRDNRGFAVSVGLTVLGVLSIWQARLSGRLGLVHINLGDKASAARKGAVAVLARLSGARVVVHLHAVELDAMWRSGGALKRWAIALPFRIASTNIVLGDVWKRWLVDDLGVRADRVDVLVNGVPAPPYVPRDHTAPRERVELLFLGNLLERKGVSDLIAALGALPAGLPQWRLTFAGGGDVAGYTAKAQAAGIADNVRFLGWVEQQVSASLLASADAMVLPSYHEGLPLVILEALGAGTPVLSTAVGAVPQFVPHDEIALIIAPGDREALTANLARLIADPALRQRLGDAGRNAYDTTFSLAVFRRNLLAIYHKQFGIG